MSKMPVLFVGHGSPMNAIEDNEFTQSWEALGQSLPRPACIVSVSAHWYTQGTRVMDAKNPRTIYDMYGFPDALYRVVYAAAGAPDTARRAAAMLTPPAEIDNSWGIDHGTWSVLCRMYPKADIPVFQLSVNARASMEEHEAIGRSLRALRDEGALIMGSGNVVHNLARVDWHTPGGFQWAGEFDGYIKRAILEGRRDDVLHYERAGKAASLAFTMPDHYAPLLYALGASDEHDSIRVFNEACVLGSLSMTSYIFG